MSRLPIPDAALDSDIAILGRKGGGKTITAKNIVERLLDLKRRVLILDPLGGWAGLRTSKDGKSAGYKVAIIGGERADYPLDLALAKPLAAVLARENVPAILDLSDARKSEQQKFLLHFLNELRRVNRDPMTIILEEADVFAPQNPMGDDSKELHGELDWIARRGRARGFRLVSICQRPARLSKDVLTQASVLVSHTLPAPQDRDAVRAWVEGNGDRDEAKKVFDTLADLETGESWVWSTVEHAKFLRRVRWPMIKTLDTTATPRAGERRIEQKTLAEVDVTAIKKALEEAKKPKVKTAVVAGLTAATASIKKDASALAKPARPEKTGETIDQKERRRTFDEGVTAGIRQANASSAALFAKFCKELTTKLVGMLDKAAKDMQATESKLDAAGPIMTGPQVKVAQALAFWRSVGNETPSRSQVAAVAGYSPRSSTWDVILSGLNVAGMIKYEPGRTIRLLVDVPPLSRAEARQRLFSVLNGKQARALEQLQANGGELTNDELAEAVAYSTGSSTYDVFKSSIRSLDLIERGPDPFRLTAWARELLSL